MAQSHRFMDGIVIPLPEEGGDYVRFLMMLRQEADIACDAITTLFGKGIDWRARGPTDYSDLVKRLLSCSAALRVITPSPRNDNIPSSPAGTIRFADGSVLTLGSGASSAKCFARNLCYEVSRILEDVMALTDSQMFCDKEPKLSKTFIRKGFTEVQHRIHSCIEMLAAAAAM